MIIYKTTNLINGKIYVGKDCGRNPGYLGSGRILMRAIKKYGKENFKKEILEVCTASSICEREIYWIDRLKSRNPFVGYNILAGGNGWSFGMKHSDKTKRKIAAANFGNKRMLGKHHSKETKIKIGIMSRGHRLSGASKRKISKANKGRMVSKETRLKLSAAGRRRIVTKETRLKLRRLNSGKNNAMYGTHLSMGAKLKISKALKGRVFSKETRKRMSEARIGIKFSREQLKNMAIAQIGKKLTRGHKKNISIGLNSYWGRKK